MNYLLKIVHLTRDDTMKNECLHPCFNSGNGHYVVETLGSTSSEHT